MADLTVLITGATNGHGLGLARRLAADGVTVVLHGRTPAKASAAAADPAAYDPAAREYLRALTDKLLLDALPARS